MKNYFRGIIGGLLGGIAAALPWIFIYVYKNSLLSVLACLVAMGVSFGYRKISGTIDKKTPLIIIIISFSIVTFINVFIIPILMLHKQNWLVSLENLLYLYKQKSFWIDMGYTLTISNLFTIIGLFVALKKIKNEKIITKDLMTVEEFNIRKEKIKQIFINQNATFKKNAIQQEELKEIFDDPNLKAVFLRLRTNLIIKKENNKYYYSEIYDNNPFLRVISLISIILLVVLIFIMLFLLILNI